MGDLDSALFGGDEEEERFAFPVENESVSSLDPNKVTPVDGRDAVAVLPSLMETVDMVGEGVAIGIKDMAEVVSTLGHGGPRPSLLDNSTGLEGAGPTGPTLLGTAITRLADETVDLLSEAGREDPQSLGGGVAREMARFGVGFAAVKPIVAAAGIKGTITNPMVAGLITDLTIYGPYEERLSNLVADLPEDTQLEVVRQLGIFLQADPNDNEAFARLKQGIEGTFLGLVAEPIARGVTAAISTPRRILRFAREQRTLRWAQQAGANVIESTDFPTSGPQLDPITTPDVAAALEAEELLRMEFSEMGIPEPGAIGESGLQSGRVTIPGFDIEKLSVEEARARILTNEYARRIRPLLESGQISQQNFDAKLEWFGRQAERVLRLETDIQGSQISERFFSNAEQARAFAERNARENSRSVTNILMRSLVDRSGNLRREVLESGPEGTRAMMLFDLAAGANPRSTVDFRRASADIYQTGRGMFGRYLPQEDIDLINQIIGARRLRTVREYRPDSEFQSGLINSVGEAQALFQHLRNTLGEDKFNDLWTRADTFFQVTRQKTDELLDAGLISAGEHERLIHFDYAPLEYLEKLDPVIAELPTGQGKTLSVNSSGIAALDEGSMATLEMDFETLLGQVVFRTNAAVARNRANQTLFQIAQRNDSPVVRTEVPRGDRDLYTQISTFVDGEKHNFFLRSSLAQEWTTDPISTHMLVQLVSGSAFVRPMATGLNPEFGLANMPRDMMLIWLQPDLYSSFLPRASMQMAADLTTVARDAFLREGRFDDYLHEGGGMNFLTHQGQVFNSDIATAPHGLRQLWSKTQEAMGYVGETTEIWTRLAAREREIRNLTVANNGVQLPEFSEMGTHRARTYLDFNQGGTVTKHLDAAFPYINAGSQGIRSFARATAADPTEMGIKLAQLATIYAGFNLANRMIYPEAWDDVPPEVKANNMVLMTGMSFQDDRGERRHIYLRIPVDHTTTWLKGSIDAIFDAQFSGRMPDDAAVEQIRAGMESSVGIVPGLTNVPAYNALNALWFNRDSFGNEIWRGSEVLSPELKYYTYPSRATSPIAVDFGELANLPPAQLEVAFRSVIPSNIYTNAINAGYSQMIADVPPDILDANMPEFMTQAWFSRRVLGVTHPFTRERQTMEFLATGEADAQEMAKRQIDEMTFRMFNEPGSVSQDTVRQFVSNYRDPEDPFFAEQLQRRHDDLFQMLKIFDTVDDVVMSQVGGRSFWFTLQSQPAAIRAQSFAQQWDMTYADPEPDNGARRRRVLVRMMRRVPGFNPSPSGPNREFAFELNKEHQVRWDQGQPTWR